MTDRPRQTDAGQITMPIHGRIDLIGRCYAITAETCLGRHRDVAHCAAQADVDRAPQRRMITRLAHPGIDLVTGTSVLMAQNPNLSIEQPGRGSSAGRRVQYQPAGTGAGITSTTRRALYLSRSQRVMPTQCRHVLTDAAEMQILLAFYQHGPMMANHGKGFSRAMLHYLSHSWRESAPARGRARRNVDRKRNAGNRPSMKGGVRGGRGENKTHPIYRSPHPLSRRPSEKLGRTIFPKMWFRPGTALCPESGAARFQKSERVATHG